MKKSIHLLLLLATMITSSPALADRAGGGGDASEMGVDAIRADILKWISTGNAKELKMSNALTYATYVNDMTKILAPHAVVVGFVTTEQEKQTSDPEQKVIVDGQLKTCRGFVSTRNHLPHILCNSDRYPKGGADQYRLIHHEYAGLAGVEQNVGASSDYLISEQITDYLAPEIVYRLSIKKMQSPQAQCFLISSSMDGHGVFRVDQVSPFIMVDQDTYYATTNVNHIFSATIRWEKTVCGGGGVSVVFHGSSVFSVGTTPLGEFGTKPSYSCDGDGSHQSIGLANGNFWVDTVESRADITCNN